MILIDATIKWKGYDPNDLPKTSEKRVCCACNLCGRVRYIRFSRGDSICRSCSGKRHSVFMRGRPSPLKGRTSPLKDRKCTDEHKHKISEAHLANHEQIDVECAVCGKIKTVPLYRKDTAKYCSTRCRGIGNMGREVTEEFRERMSFLTRGWKNGNWQGGTSSEHAKWYSDVGNAWRNSILERDGFVCQSCNQHGGDLNAHHILPYSQHPDFRAAIDNGITLCEDCHREIKGKEHDFIPHFLGIIFDNKGIEIFGGR